jgi:hypothetical protein
MKAIQLNLVVAASLVLSARMLVAQRPSDVAQIERAAAAYSASHFISGDVAFDPRPNSDVGVIAPRTSDEAKALAGALRAKHVGDKSQFYSCTGSSPRSCRVAGVDVVVSMNRPEVDGNTAFVIVRTYRPTQSTKAPVVREETRLRLEKQNDTWVVTGPVGGGSIT